MKHVAKVLAAAAIVAAIVGGSAFAQDTQKKPADSAVVTDE